MDKLKTFLVVPFSVFLAMSPVHSFVRRIVYPASRLPVPEIPPLPLEHRVIKSSDGNSIISWLWMQDTASDRIPVVMYFHGNGDNLETMRLSGIFEDFHDLNVHFIAMDYPGYGNSTGKPSEVSIEKAAHAFFAQVQKEFPDNPKFICGWSLGAAVAIKMAAKYTDSITGLIAVSPWTSLKDCASVHYPRFLVELLLRDEYNSVGAALHITCPSLVLHGAEDRIIPASQGRKVADNLPALQNVKFFPLSGHNDIFSYRGVWREMSEFIKNVLPAP
jgi:pimeloyl-ACP methyl ester carboxylesterase